MSLYIIIFFILLIFSAITLITKRYDDLIYWICFFILTVFACLRFGQGTDYSSYESLYIIAPDNFADIGLYNRIAHGEIGWKYLMIFCKIIGLKFKYFVSIYTFIEMLLLNRFINKFCPYKTIALLLAYPTLYLTYIFSLLRQGMVVLIFLGILYSLLINNKLFKYFIISLFMISFHKSAITLLFVPLIVKLKIKTIFIMFTCSFIISILIGLWNGNLLTSWEPLLLRIIILAFVAYLYRVYRQEKYDFIMDLTLKIYLYGQTLYFLFWSADVTWGSRMAYQFLVLDIFIITFMLLNLKKSRGRIFTIVVLFTTFMFFKNMDSYIWQSNYYSDVTVFNFPYITIFNENDMWKYRDRVYSFYD